jgi:hypothetical protein
VGSPVPPAERANDERTRTAIEAVLGLQTMEAAIAAGRELLALDLSADAHGEWP